MTFCIYDMVSYGSQTKTTESITVGIPVIASHGRNLPDLNLALSIMYERPIVIPKPIIVDATAIYCKCIGFIPIVFPTRKLVADRAMSEQKKITN